eukprot:CAMPEP_0113525468 /NCGR_PEP_ID=MMETSP0015_2-20120614/178_1 /TAXON_ID=2838 /ORGANISM="Odontella" /LENGTH=309 /DNA_ID=CAMNT_0000423637 /DNA_START=103 /DNA_END=1032 /DNA_ORIENTATION=- /assembly_acc=CAM_ASM_000160
MSPQSALTIARSSAESGRMSNAVIAQAANEAFAYQRLDKNLANDDETSVVRSNPLVEGPGPTSGPSRFNLRKRKVSVGEEPEGPLASRVSTSFLSGVFADINNAASSSAVESADSSGDRYVSDCADSCAPSPVPRKKSRISMTRSLSRSSKSYRSLGAALFGERPAAPSTGVTTDSCVAGKDSDSLTEAAVDDLLSGIAFPHLPATVSESSCSSTNLTQGTRTPGRHASGPEISSSDESSSEHKESYGWFVSMEDDDNKTARVSDAYKHSSSNDLAFSAVTAPKRVDDDAEVQWAQAADTVDSVLGDLF